MKIISPESESSKTEYSEMFALDLEERMTLPEPITTFTNPPLDDRLFCNIDLAGYKVPTPVQKYSIPIVMGGRDLMACDCGQSRDELQRSWEWSHQDGTSEPPIPTLQTTPSNPPLSYWHSALNGPDSTLDLELESYFERCHSNILSPSPESDRETTENERPPVLMDTLMDKITPKDKRTEQVLRYDTMVAGRLGGRPVSAFADFGAATDLMSMEYVRRQGHQVNKTQPGRVRLAGARSVRSEGTVTLPWQFDGELSAFNRTFSVLSSCLHDVVLGSHFIQLTSLFSKYKDRVIRKLRSVHLPRFCATDNPLYRMQGSVDGYSVLALPDTGSDFLLISRSCAKRSYLPIKTGREYEKYFQYADGSYGSTKGLVEDVAWTYPHGTTYIRDFYVLDDMPCDVILSEEFLRESQAFEKHGVLSIEAVETVDDVSLVREVGGWLYDVFTHRFTGHQSDPLTEDAVATWVHEERQELNRRDFEEQRIERLPEEQRQAAREANEACSHEWLQNNPRPEVRPPRLHGSSQQSEVGFAVG